MKIKTLDDASELKISEIRDTYLVLTDGHPTRIGVYIERNENKIFGLSEKMERFPFESSFAFESRALAKGLELVPSYCNENKGKEKIIVANDNITLMRYAGNYFKSPNKGKIQSGVKGIVNNLLDNVRGVTEEYPIKLGIIIKDSNGRNPAHEMCKEHS